MLAQAQGARQLARRAANKLFGGVGYDLVRKHYYSPIPDPDEVPPEVWARRSDLPGVRFDNAAGLAFVRRELARFLAEYRPTAGPDDGRRFYLDNGFYESVDAELLYAMTRRFEPQRVLELGSGMSTLVIADARERNDPDARSWHIVCDPFPRDDLALDAVADVRPLKATDVPMDLFAELGPNDMLFVDTTHTVKVGGDVNRIILDVLPVLAPGVIVHVHDIFLPWEYPRDFVVERRFFWAEQYLVQAFLSFNDQYDVLCSAHALVRSYPETMAELVPSMGPETRPSAMWLQRVDA